MKRIGLDRATPKTSSSPLGPDRRRCAGGCAQCPADLDQCPAEAGEHRGWRLALSAAGAFLLPLALAMLGTQVGGKEQTGKFLGGMLGLAVGLLTAILVGKLPALGKRKAEEPGGLHAGNEENP